MPDVHDVDDVHEAHDVYEAHDVHDVHDIPIMSVRRVSCPPTPPAPCAADPSRAARPPMHLGMVRACNARYGHAAVVIVMCLTCARVLRACYALIMGMMHADCA